MNRKNRSIHRRTMTNLAIAASLALCGATALASEREEMQQTEQAEPSWQGEARDAWVDGKVEASYALNRHLNPFAIDTHVDGGVVHLTGAVESQIDKDLAEQIAKSVDGVTRVENDLVVKADARKEAGIEEPESRDFGTLVDDATTTARVKFALLANESTEGLAIDVDTNAGTVSLGGSVASKQERALAEEIARNTDGVEKVENHLMVAERS